MLLGEIFRVALGAIRANKMRSFLTTLGIIIGIAAVIAMVALGEGAQRSVQARLQALGTNVLTVRPGQEFFGGIDRGDRRLTAKDAEALLEAPNITAVSPEMSRRQQVSFLGRNANLNIVGGWPTYFRLQNHSLIAGRLFSEGEERGRQRFAVIGSKVAEKLGSGEPTSLLNKNISIRGIPFQVIGVLGEKGDTGFNNPDESIYIPLGTAQFRVFGTERVGSILVQATSATNMDAAMGDIDRLIRRSHRIRSGDPSDFNIRNQATLLSTFQETTRTFTFLLAGIAFVSLVVGGIGIMNIMLVSVTERTKEIGIRKALGARRRDILMQFLIEALVLCLAGGVIGASLGIGAAITLQKLASWNTAVAPYAVLLAVGFSGAVGVFFGMWPARRAAKLDPIAALRWE
jgi:putative ABC transport system permease protein